MEESRGPVIPSSSFGGKHYKYKKTVSIYEKRITRPVKLPEGHLPTSHQSALPNLSPTSVYNMVGNFPLIYAADTHRNRISSL